jgi:hypothetical protein
MATKTTAPSDQPLGETPGQGDGSPCAIKRHRFSRVIASLAACFLGLGLVTLASPANAAAVTSGVNIRPCVDLSNPVCSPVGTTISTTINKIRCYRDGSWATGAYASNRWFLVYLADGREGYVHSSFVSGQYPTPECTTLAYVRAADKALSYVGQVYATSDIANKYAASDWAPGPFGEWSGDCAKLTNSSYRFGAGVGYASGNAINQYYAYRASGQVYGGLPRYGAPVFYNIAAPYGHTAIYVGGTTIVSTQGMDGAHLPVARRDINSFGNYLGWAKIG